MRFATSRCLDWETLREQIKTHGLRNSTLSALMPSETSSQISNATNGIEPPRGHISIKASKDGILRQVVPEYERLKDQYELLWDMPSNDGYLQLVGVMQKFIDQGDFVKYQLRSVALPEWQSADEATAERSADRLQVWRENALLPKHP